MSVYICGHLKISGSSLRDMGGESSPLATARIRIDSGRSTDRLDVISNAALGINLPASRHIFLD